MTPQEEEALKARILKLEEEKERLEKAMAGRPESAAMEEKFAVINAALSELRKEWAELKPKPPVVPAPAPGPARNDPDLEDWLP